MPPYESIVKSTLMGIQKALHWEYINVHNLFEVFFNDADKCSGYGWEVEKWEILGSGMMLTKYMPTTYKCIYKSTYPWMHDGSAHLLDAPYV